MGRKIGKDGAAGAGRGEGGRASRSVRAHRPDRGKLPPPAGREGISAQARPDRGPEGLREPAGQGEAWATPRAENAIRTRNLARFMLYGFALQVQGGQRPSAYSLQDCLDDVESIMETLVHSLTGICSGAD